MGRLAPWLTALACIFLWWLIIIAFGIKSFILPTPWETLKALYTFRGPLFTNGMATLFTTLLGFGIAVGVGLLLGILVGSSRLAYQALYPLLVAFNSVPKARTRPDLRHLVRDGNGAGGRHGIHAVVLSRCCERRYRIRNH